MKRFIEGAAHDQGALFPAHLDDFISEDHPATDRRAPFGALKAWLGAMHVLTKTLPKVKIEMSLQVLVCNFKRMIKIFGARQMIQVISADTERERQNA